MLYENLEVPTHELPDLDQAEFSAHPRRYLNLRIGYKALFFLLLLAPVSAPLFAGDSMQFFILLSLWSAILVALLLLEFKSFPMRGYLLRTHDISYRKGWLFSQRISIPYNRIQHSEVSQGPWERYMRLATLKVFTAGGSGADLSLHGLDPEEAEKMKAWITEKTAQHV